MAFLCHLRSKAEEAHSLNLQVWAAKTAFGGGVKAPEIPSLLK